MTYQSFISLATPLVWGMLVFIVAWIVVRTGNIFRYIPNDHVGVKEKLFSRKGSIKDGFIALNGEAGFQPDLLRGGPHFFLPFLYRIHTYPLISIPQGKIGYVFARGGEALPPTQTLAANRVDEDFQDVRHFLEGDSFNSQVGQRGLQRRILREGTHPINLAQFIVIAEDQTYEIELGDMDAKELLAMGKTIADRDGFNPIVISDKDDKIGVVTVHDGPALNPGEIIAPTVEGHNNFQSPELFLANGGHRGRQLQTLVEGTYYLNRAFSSVDFIPKTTIEVGWVGVVVSYTGPKGSDLSGDDYGHGELVETGCKGVWKEPLLPGKYPFNTYAGHIVTVPTTNFVLKWVASAAGSHSLDENLSEINLITKDAFEPVLPLSLVLHIDYRRAPELVQRFGDTKKLVDQTLDPMVSAFFKNTAQTKELIQLLQERAQIQDEAGKLMAARLSTYTLEFQEVLIGTPKPKQGDTTMEQILVQLRMRQVAKEQEATYESQKKAMEKQKELSDATAAAEAQTALTQSSIKIQIAENEGSAKVKLAQKEAEKITILAEADKTRVTAEGEGEANAILAKGTATAEATKAQVEAYGGAEFRFAEQVANRMFEAITAGKQAIVPQIMVTGNNGGDNNSASSGVGGLYTGIMASLWPLVTQLKQGNDGSNKGNGATHD